MNALPPSLLLVDDDAALAAMLREFLELQGFTVAIAGDGEAALASLPASPPDMVILDVMLPGIDGFEVLRRLRESHDMPVIMLTARGTEPDRILGLMRGADDYLPKPFNPLELVARIRAVLKRARHDDTERTEVLAAGPVSLNMRRKQLQVHGKVIALTAAEMRILEQLLRHPDEVLTRARLTETALDRPIEFYDRSLDTLISKLRSKLSAAGVSRDCIRGVRGHGYALDSAALGEP